MKIKNLAFSCSVIVSVVGVAHAQSLPEGGQNQNVSSGNQSQNVFVSIPAAEERNTRNTYIEFGASATELRGESLNGEVRIKPLAASFTLGHNFHKNLALEATVFGTEERTTEDKRIDSKDKEELGLSAVGVAIYVKPQLHLSNDTTLFARVGYSGIQTVARINKETENSETYKSISYGVGIQTAITKNIYGQLNYMVLSKADEIKYESAGVSLGWRF